MISYHDCSICSRLLIAVVLGPSMWWAMASSEPSAPCLADLHSEGPWLFNLKDDPYEKNNLYASEPQRAVELKSALEAAAKEMLYPLNAPGAPGAHKAPEDVTCPNGIWTPWVPGDAQAQLQ
jgi:hypothetical protein